MKSNVFRLSLGLATAAIASLNAAAASAFPTIQLDQATLDTFNASYVQNERAFKSDAGSFQVDLNSLFFSNSKKDVEVYFVNEGARNNSQLSFSLNGGASSVIFDQITSQESVVSETNGVLTLGEGRNLGQAAKGTQVEFSFMVNDYRSGKSTYTYSTNEANNPDGLQHLVGYEYLDGAGEKWLILGLEDRYGDGSVHEGASSDRDFNDVVIAVKGLSTTPVPEPGMMLGLAGTAVAGLLKLRRRDEV